MYKTKPIAIESVAGALAKAERYRLLNEPGEAESICQDILAIEPGNEQAQISLLLALTDQIPGEPQAFAKAIAMSRTWITPTIAPTIRESRGSVEPRPVSR